MRVPRIAAPLMLAAAVLAGCTSGGAATSAPATAPVAATPAPATPAASASTEPSPATGGVSVNLADTALGSVLADGEGRILYVFTADAEGVSNCSGDCLANWPALLSDAVPALGSGLDAASFALIARPDGGSQVTFHGMPLYYFVGDTAPGQTNGQGVGEKWFVVDAEGELVGGPTGRAY